MLLLLIVTIRVPSGGRFSLYGLNVFLELPLGMPRKLVVHWALLCMRHYSQRQSCPGSFALGPPYLDSSFYVPCGNRLLCSAFLFSLDFLNSVEELILSS